MPVQVNEMAAKTDLIVAVAEEDIAEGAAAEDTVETVTFGIAILMIKRRARAVRILVENGPTIDIQELQLRKLLEQKIDSTIRFVTLGGLLFVE